MRIVVTSVFVDDQDKALQFYTQVLGFVKKTEIPLGEARWLTVVAPDDPDGTGLLLEPEPGTTTTYKDVVEIKDPDHQVRTLSMLTGDGARPRTSAFRARSGPRIPPGGFRKAPSVPRLRRGTIDDERRQLLLSWEHSGLGSIPTALFSVQSRGGGEETGSNRHGPEEGHHVLVPAPGLYEVAIGSIHGYEPIPVERVLVPGREFVEIEMSLVRGGN